MTEWHNLRRAELVTIGERLFGFIKCKGDESDVSLPINMALDKAPTTSKSLVQTKIVFPNKSSDAEPEPSSQAVSVTSSDNVADGSQLGADENANFDFIDLGFCFSSISDIKSNWNNLTKGKKQYFSTCRGQKIHAVLGLFQGPVSVSSKIKYHSVKIKPRCLVMEVLELLRTKFHAPINFYNQDQLDSMWLFVSGFKIGDQFHTKMKIDNGEYQWRPLDDLKIRAGQLKCVRNRRCQVLPGKRLGSQHVGLSVGAEHWVFRSHSSVQPVKDLLARKVRFC